jgi:hypothetical protein
LDDLVLTGTRAGDETTPAAGDVQLHRPAVRDPAVVARVVCSERCARRGSRSCRPDGPAYGRRTEPPDDVLPLGLAVDADFRKTVSTHRHTILASSNEMEQA